MRHSKPLSTTAPPKPLDRRCGRSQAQLTETAKLGIDVETLATRLQEDGLKQFEDAFAKLLAPLGLSGLNGRPRNLNHFKKSQSV